VANGPPICAPISFFSLAFFKKKSFILCVDGDYEENMALYLSTMAIKKGVVIF